MDALPPIAIALVALAFVFVWQVVGTCLLAPLLRWGGLSRGYSLIVAWLVFMPLVGSLALAMALAGHATPAHFRIMATVITVSGLVTIFQARRRVFSLTRGLWEAMPDRRSRWVLGAGFTFLALQLLFAAHPQRLYDQLNYHLVAGKRVLAFGGLTPRVFDPHLYIAGPVEYAMLWPRALWANDLLQVGVGQAWVFVATVLPMLAAVGLLARREGMKPGLLFAGLLAIPSLVPNNELVSMLKPGAFLLSGTFIALLAPVSSRRLLAAVAVPFMLLFTACNPTYVHASIALLFAVLVAEGVSPRMLLRASPLLWLGATALGISFYKSWALTGTFLYPSDAQYLGSPMADQETFAYWKSIAFSTGEPFWQRWWGGVQVPSLNRGLVLWLCVVGPVAGYLIATKKRSGWDWRGPRLPAVFAAGFVACWPLFYDSAIYPRFVAGYVGALLAFGFTVLMRTEGRLRKALIVATALLGCSVSHSEVLVRKIYTWNGRSALEAYVPQFPRIVGSAAVNQWATAQDSVLADDNGKYFFDSAVLTGLLSPDERKSWADLLAHPQEAARAMRLKAIVVSRENRSKTSGQIPFAGPINEVWDKLAAYGTEVVAGTDLVLKSECFFAAKPCPALSDARWTSNTP